MYVRLLFGNSMENITHGYRARTDKDVTSLVDILFFFLNSLIYTEK